MDIGALASTGARLVVTLISQRISTSQKKIELPEHSLFRVNKAEETVIPEEKPSSERSPISSAYPETKGQSAVATGCLSCSRSHLSTVAGALGESLRFARDAGIAHPEVQRRLDLAEQEMNIMERIDLSADALAKSPPEEKRLAEEYLPRISVDKLEITTAEASVLGQEFRLRAGKVSQSWC